MPLTDNAYGQQEVQLALWEMLKEIHAVCREEKIEYSALGGTMLGALREKGFIPWDDDVDLVFMPQELKRFMDVFPKKSVRYTISTGDTWVARVVPRDRAQGGVFVDLFRYAPVCKSAVGQKLKVFRLRTLQGMLKQDVDYSRFSWGKRALLRFTGLLGRLMSRQQKLARYRRIGDSRRGCDEGRLYVCDDTFACLALQYDAACAQDFEDVPFEDGVIRVSKRADEMLRLQYGDYQTPPPMAQRVSTHDAQRAKGEKA